MGETNVGEEECVGCVRCSAFLGVGRKGGREDGPVFVLFMRRYPDGTAGTSGVDGVVGEMKCVEESPVG